MLISASPGAFEAVLAERLLNYRLPDFPIADELLKCLDFPPSREISRHVREAARAIGYREK
jgi:hypothetical protein